MRIHLACSVIGTTSIALAIASLSCGGGYSPSSSSGPLPGVIGDCGNAPNGSGTGTVDYVMVYKSSLSEWCVDRNVWSANQQAISGFFSYGDAVITELQGLFPITPPSQPFIFEVKSPFGGASTGCDFGGGAYCNTVTDDAYYNSFSDPVTGASVSGFWGYVLTLHEAINVYTGLVSGGWPTDWWADHRSPFPNAMDAEIMQAIGTAQNNTTLLAAATAQNNRFNNQSQNPSGYDSEVAMFEGFYTQFGGFGPYANAFKFAAVEDGISWPSVSGDPNYTGDNDYSAQLSEYVIAYLQLGFGTTTDLTQTFVNSGVGTLDNQISPYSVDPNAVLSIANAHCSIQAAKGAGVDVSAQLSVLQSGNYQSAQASGGTQATCPSECLWSSSQSQCVAKW